MNLHIIEFLNLISEFGWLNLILLFLTNYVFLIFSETVFFKQISVF